MTRTYSGVPYKTTNEFALPVRVYHAALDDSQAIQEVCDKLTTQIADFLNTQATPKTFGLKGDQLNGYVTSAYVTDYEYGYTLRDNKLLRANRITLTAMSKTSVVEAPQ